MTGQERSGKNRRGEERKEQERRGEANRTEIICIDAIDAVDLSIDMQAYSLSAYRVPTIHTTRITSLTLTTQQTVRMASRRQLVCSSRPWMRLWNLWMVWNLRFKILLLRSLKGQSRKVCTDSVYVLIVRMC